MLRDVTGAAPRGSYRSGRPLPTNRAVTLYVSSPPKLRDILLPALHGLVHGLMMGWPLIVLIVLAGVGKFALRLRRAGRL